MHILKNGLFIFLICNFFNASTQTFLSNENVLYYSKIVAPTIVTVKDLDNDNDLDIIAALEESIFWYENIGSSNVFAPRKVIDTLSGDITAINTSDINGDGLVDLMAAVDNQIFWFENTGEGIFGPKQNLDTFSARLQSFHVIDLNGDGYKDVLAVPGDYKAMVYLENTDGKGKFNNQQEIIKSAVSVRSVCTSDLDNDGDEDIITASARNNKIAWYENMGGFFSDQRTISDSTEYATMVCTGDLDGDGDMDVISVSSIDDKLAWYENIDGQGSFSYQKVISTSGNFPQFVNLTDLDGDGDIDILSASYYDDKIAWYENINGEGTFSNEKLISKRAWLAGYVDAGDIDGDGDVDVISAACDYKIAWYKNTLPLKILTNPKSAIVAENSSIALHVVTNEYANNYQWQIRKGNDFLDLSNSEIYTGVQTDSMIIKSFNPERINNQYRCLVSSSTDTIISLPADLKPAPKDQILIAKESSCYTYLPDYTADLEYIQTPMPFTEVAGSTVVTLTPEDSSGNREQVSFVVSVVDSTAPFFIEIPEISALEADSGGQALLPDYTKKIVVIDNCTTEDLLQICQSPEPSTDVSLLSEVTVRITAIDNSGNNRETAFNVEIPDLVPPEILSAPDDATMEANSNCEVSLPNYTANLTVTDNRNWTSSLQITQQPKPYTNLSDSVNIVTLRVTDDAGNSTNHTFEIRILDLQKPFISCAENISIDLDKGHNDYTVKGTEFDPVSFSDNCEIDEIINNYNGASSLNGAVFPADTTTVIWTITDKSGNQAHCSLNLMIDKYMETGYNSLNQDGIYIYPNPVTDELIIDCSHNRMEHVTIYDILGKTLIRKIHLKQREALDLSLLSRGIYIIQIQTDVKSLTKRIIKE